ncbi:putative mfs aflatoxin efflux [Diplodia seriata]|uniref:Putative mfs aflatoxin efflux n=1 Tax=Diplodia seriata TaxID=420778 RepID=A0A0G2GHW5_9PEZI|nr:putative mfs aflatoxin efflux [Diplodia seriata]
MTDSPRNFWHAMSQGFRDPDNDSDSSQDDVREGVVRSAWDLLYTKTDHLLLGSRKTPVDISTLHPEPVHIFRLWQIYLDNVNPLLKVTHPPSLQGRIIEAAGNVSRTNAALEALMFSIYCVSVQSLSDDDCQAIFSSPKQDVLAAHHFGCEQALLNCGFLRTGNRDCLTALFLYLVSVGPRTDPRSLSSMLGVAIRIAQRMGIDSESANARCSALEAEIRRRLWWALVLFDTRIGELANYRSVTLGPTWDCSIPLNVNDSDLWTEMREPPSPAQAKCTDTLFAAVRSEMGEFLRHAAVHLDFTTPALKSVAKEVEEEGGLDGLERRLNEKYLRFCDPENPLHFMAIWTARVFLARCRLVEHNSKASIPSAQLTEAQRNAALSHALAMLDGDTKIMTSPLTKGYRWLFQFHFPFPAYVHAVQELKRRPVGEHAERAWQVMGAHYDSRFAFSPLTADENPLFEIFAGMVLQAWEPREAALREAGRPLTPPRIVSRFRQKMAEMAANVQDEEQQQQRHPASAMDMVGLMPVDFGGHGLFYGVEGQDSSAETGFGGFPNPDPPGQFPLDMGAIPQITDEFHSLPDVGWYGSAYTLTCCSFQLLFGKLYTFYSVKAVMLTSVLLFELGSVVCGAAPSSAAFIVGRAIAGVGAAGIFAGCIVSMVYAVPLEKRPKLQGMFGALFGIASIIGPLIGGAFTSSSATWRWCFYVNLPFGAVSMVVIALCLKVPDRDSTKLPWIQKLSQLDVLGTAVLIPGVVCLLLALQWGGNTYAWSNGRIVALLTLGVILLVAFAAVQVCLPKTATIPPRIFKQRSIVAGCWATVCIGSSQYICVYFLPVWFQSIKGSSAVESGIQLLPLLLSMVLASILGGLTTTKIGYYTPLAIVGTCIMAVGAGLLTTLQVGTSEGKWIGYQILYGFGMGLCFQAPNLAAQTVLPTADVPVGTSLMFFSQLLGAAVFVSVGQNVLDNQLVSRLSGLLPGFDAKLVTEGGATSLLVGLPAHLREAGLVAYNEALRNVFQIGLILACLTVLGTAALEWRSVLKKAEENRREKTDAVTAEKV